LTSANREAGNQSFEIRKGFYAASKFAIIGKITEDNATWTVERIVIR
jgi:hypothetical protein